MAYTSIALQLNFEGPNPIVTNNKRLTLLNLARLVRGIDNGTQFRSTTPTTVVVAASQVAASATATPAAVAAADTLSIGGTALTATQKRAKGTITCASAIANDTITVNGVLFTAVAGAAAPGDATFSIDTSDTATAASIVTQLAAYVDPRLSGVISSKSAIGVVTVYAVAQGTGGNAYTLASSSNSTLAVSGAVLAGGAAATNNTFDYVGTDVQTGAAIAAAINASTTAAVSQTTATSSATTGVVTVTSKQYGTGGNAITFTSSNGSRLAVTGSGFLASGSTGAPTKWTF